MNGTIYIIRNNITERVYVGQTRRQVELRWEEHQNACSFSNHELYNDFLLFGLENFTFSVVEQGVSCQQELSKLERDWISKLQANNPVSGYNRSAGGECGWTPEQSRRKFLRETVERAKNGCVLNKHRDLFRSIRAQAKGVRTDFQVIHLLQKLRPIVTAACAHEPERHGLDEEAIRAQQLGALRSNAQPVRQVTFVKKACSIP